MLVFFSGKPADPGTYWNLSAGESVQPSAAAFILAPVIGLAFTLLMPLLLLCVMVLFIAKPSVAAEPAMDAESTACLSCHQMLSRSKTLANGETLSLRMTGTLFRGSVHEAVPCTGCHSDMSLGAHPKTVHASQRAFALQVNLNCRNCHGDEPSPTHEMHNYEAARANAPPCSDCHGSHAIRKVFGLKSAKNTTQYCLTCHAKSITTLVNGKSISRTVDHKVIRGSVHSRHGCSDCHEEYSKTSHPLRRPGSRREFTIAASSACARCHSDKKEDYDGSIHAACLKKGDRNAPVCTDCHGSHAVGPVSAAATSNSIACRKCHEDAYAQYASSVHGLARSEGKENAPLCISCHFAHKVSPAMVSQSIRSACFECHHDAPDRHEAWLPNAAVHLETIACTVCHVPEGVRGVYLSVRDRNTGQRLSDSHARKALGSDFRLLEQAREESLSGKELWTIYRKLNEGEYAVSMDGVLGLRDCGQSHGLAQKEQALKACDTCHRAGSDYFTNVNMVLSSPDGREQRYPVHQAALGSMYSLIPLNDFYALGSTRLKIIDVLGIAMILSAIGVVFIHNTARALLREASQRPGSGTHRKEGTP
ncbi:MAG: hypothetical protein A2X56_03275 [Nitrospirae bacterium GWC2_57_13]|jgi:hypothetical protein|nr:MAG: hypothetical protein A2X56_03275 [Nitrospirae bacterium GWC2_57_13]OGW45111.1 MAG: hypothetical protein A2X57_02755 [Nitrospirae bacterium GWD2_57_8]